MGVRELSFVLLDWYKWEESGRILAPYVTGSRGVRIVFWFFDGRGIW